MLISVAGPVSERVAEAANTTVVAITQNWSTFIAQA